MNHFFSAWLQVGRTNRKAVAADIEKETKYCCTHNTLSIAFTGGENTPKMATIRAKADEKAREAVMAEVLRYVPDAVPSDLIVADLSGHVYVLSKRVGKLQVKGHFQPV